MALGAALLITGGVDERDVPFKLVEHDRHRALFEQIPCLVIIAFAVGDRVRDRPRATRFGRYTYAIGSNEEAARRAGVNVDRHLIKVYALAGTLSGLAGFMSLARFGTTTIGGHATDNLKAIAAVVIGGTSLFGGIGTILGTVFGVFIPAVLQNGFVIVGVQPFWQQVAVGAVLIVAVYLDQLRRRASASEGNPTMEEEVSPSWATTAQASRRSGVAGSLRRARCRVRRRRRGGVGGGGGASRRRRQELQDDADRRRQGRRVLHHDELRAQDKAKELGVTLDFQGPNEFDAAQQTPIVNAVAAKKPDAVLIAPTDTKALYAPIKQLADGGSKIVLVDTTLEQPDMAVSQIASDNEGGGARRPKTLAELIGGKGKVFVVNVKPGISTTDARAKGFEEGPRRPGSSTSGSEYSNDEPAKAAAITKAALAKHPDLKGIFATNLFSAEGAASGVREAGKQGQ